MSPVRYVVRSYFGLSILCLSLDCGCSAKIINLGTNDGNDATDNEQPQAVRLVDGESGICVSYFAHPIPYFVESSRLHWFESLGNESSFQVLLRSCDIGNCAATITNSRALQGSIYDYTCPLGDSLVLVDSDTIYWTAYQNGPILMHVGLAPESAFQSEALPAETKGKFLVVNGFLYLATMDGGVFRCKIGSCSNSLERFAMTPPSGVAPFQNLAGGIFGKDDDYFYVAENPPSGSAGRLLRVPFEVDATFDVLARLADTDDVRTAKLYENNLYWLENTNTGQLKSCPKSGCADSPKVLMSGLQFASQVEVDSSNLYVLEAPQVHQIVSTSNLELDAPGHILRCPITGCSAPSILLTTTTEYTLDNLVVDDQFVYVSGNYCSVPSKPSETCGYIAATPK